MNKVIIIAEAGVNHNGDIAIAKQLIDEAKQAGADYVKFQTATSPSAVTSKFANMAEYQKKKCRSGGKSVRVFKRFYSAIGCLQRIKIIL